MSCDLDEINRKQKQEIERKIELVHKQGVVKQEISLKDAIFGNIQTLQRSIAACKIAQPETELGTIPEYYEDTTMIQQPTNQCMQQYYSLPQMLEDSSLTRSLIIVEEDTPLCGNDGKGPKQTEFQKLMSYVQPQHSKKLGSSECHEGSSASNATLNSGFEADSVIDMSQKRRIYDELGSKEAEWTDMKQSEAEIKSRRLLQKFRVTRMQKLKSQKTANS